MRRASRRQSVISADSVPMTAGKAFSRSGMGNGENMSCLGKELSVDIPAECAGESGHSV